MLLGLALLSMLFGVSCRAKAAPTAAGPTPQSLVTVGPTLIAIQPTATPTSHRARGIIGVPFFGTITPVVPSGDTPEPNPSVQPSEQPSVQPSETNLPTPTELPGPPTDTPEPTETFTITPRPSPTQTPTITPTPGPTACPKDYCVIASSCRPDTNTRAIGTVYDKGGPVNGVRVRVSYADGGPPIVNDFISGHNPISPQELDPAHPGYYQIGIAEGQPVDGNWWVFLVDDKGKEISVGRWFKTTAVTTGNSCQVGVTDFSK